MTMEPVRIRNKRTNKFYTAPGWKHHTFYSYHNMRTAQKSVANLVNSGVPLTDLEIETAPSADPLTDLEIEVPAMTSSSKLKKTRPTHQEDINTEFYNRDQSWTYERIVRVGEYTFLLTIRRNAYDIQSHMHGHVLKGMDGWKRIITRPVNEFAACYSTSYVDKQANIAPFFEDSEKILTILKTTYSV